MIFRCFVIMPYNNRSEKVYGAIVNSTNAPGLNHEIEFVRADRSRLASEVESNVRKHLELCDFAIAEVSKQNSNVLFEVGYVVALRKPLIFILNREGGGASIEFNGSIYITI